MGSRLGGVGNKQEQRLGGQNLAEGCVAESGCEGWGRVLERLAGHMGYGACVSC